MEKSRIGLVEILKNNLLMVVLAGVLVSLTVKTPVYAQAESDEALKELSEDLYSFQLKNGLTVVAARDNSNPVVSVKVFYRVGSSDDPGGLEGLTHLVELISCKGTESFHPDYMEEIALRYGGKIHYGTSRDYVTVGFDFASQHLEEALKMEAARMTTASLLPEQLETQIDTTFEEISQSADEVRDNLWNLMLPTFFRRVRYSNPAYGYEDSLKRITRRDLMEHYHRFFNPSNAVLVIAGDISNKTIKDTVLKHFGNLEGGSAPLKADIEEPELSMRAEITREFKDTNPLLCLLFQAPAFNHQDSIIMECIAGILGVGRTSRLYSGLIAKNRIASNVTSAYSAYRQAGILSVEAKPVRGRLPGEIEKAIFFEIKRMAENGPTESELARIKNRLMSDFLMDQQEAGGRASKIGQFAILDSIDSYRGYLDNLYDVTVDDIKRVAAQWLRWDRCVSGVALPIGGISNPLPSIVYEPAEPWNGPAVAKRVQIGRGGRSEPQRIIMDNGMTLMLWPDHSLPVTSLKAYLKTGIRAESWGLEGIHSLVASSLPWGVEGMTGDEISTLVESKAAKLYSDEDGISATFFQEDISFFVDLVAKLLRKATFPRQAVEMERERLLARLAENRTSTSSTAWTLYSAMLYGDHPYATPSYGTESSVEFINFDDLFEYYTNYYVPDNVILAVAGDFDVEQFKNLAETSFADWNGTVPPLMISDIPDPDGRQTFYANMDKSQSVLYMGNISVNRSDPDYYPLQVMDYILGYGPGYTDRIGVRLNNQLGITYIVSAMATWSELEDPADFSVYAACAPENVQKVIEVCEEEIQKFRLEGPTLQETEDSKGYLIGSFGFKYDTISELTERLVEAERFDLGLDFHIKYPQIIRNITPAMVKDVANEHIRPDEFSLVVVGPDTNH